MLSVLFVDDEPNVLSGLRRMLRPHRSEWQMHFMADPEAAIASFDTAHYDVIVTDMRMPRIDGAQVLRAAHARQPEAVRLVLSGHTELEAALRAVPVAHQFLTKPCEPERLCNAIERARSLQELLQSDRLKAAVSGLKQLPSAPGVYRQVTAALAEPDIDMAQVAALVEQDAAMSAKVLQLVNSAFFGMPQKIGYVRDATAYLGANMMKNLILTVDAFRSFDAKPLPGFSIEQMQQHALLVGKTAAKLVPEQHQKEDAFTAGVLHDIGKLILATQMKNELMKVVGLVKRERLGWCAAEREVIGATHAEIGAYLLGIWALPYSIVEAVAFHHAPQRVAHTHFDTLCAVHVANSLAHADSEADPLHFDLLQELGVEQQLPTWQETARQVALETAS